MKLPDTARLCEPCQKLSFGADTCPECGGPVKRVGKTKYKNRPCVVDGVWFASKKEAERWRQLTLLERAGKIMCLERQAGFPLDVNGEHIFTYRSDFSYLEASGSGKPVRVVEDVKSPITKKLALYMAKKRLMKAIYGIVIREV